MRQRDMKRLTVKVPELTQAQPCADAAAGGDGRPGGIDQSAGGVLKHTHLLEMAISV